MNLRMHAHKANPAAYQTMMKLEETVKQMTGDPILFELVKIRASQINGCAFCVDMHTKDLRKLGESEERMSLIVVWRETPLFTEKERAALALAEAVTQISKDGVPQELYDEVRKHFNETEFISLIMTINVINNWNRIAISTGMFPGCYDN